MANSTLKRIVRDGQDNAVVELVGSLDTSAAIYTEAAIITLADFTDNLVSMALAGFRLDKLQYSLSDSLAARLSWDATADQIMIGVAGRGKISFKHYGGIVPNRAAAGYTGSINLEINNVVVAAGTPIQTFTLLLGMKKLYA